MKIVATILLVIAMLGSALLFIRCSKEAKSMGDIEGTPMSGMVSSMLGGDIPSAGAWSTGSYMAIGAVLGCLFGIVAAFIRSKNVGFAGAAAAGLFSILLIVFVPSLDPGMFGGANPKTIAIIVGLIGLAGAAIVGFVASKRTA